MKILIIGDITGKPGRRILKALLPQLRRRHGAQLVIANGENAAGGMGITEETAEEIFAAGVDVITGGNHTWRNRDVYPFLDGHPRVLRPANYPPGAPGRGAATVETDGRTVGVLNLQGRVFMGELDDPFRAADEQVAELRRRSSVIIVDFHAEATSEKIAMGWHLDGRVSAVAGTHTHVQTADERVLPGGTAYITDVGMTGPRDGVIGMDREVILEHFRSGLPSRFTVAGGAVQLNAVAIEVDGDGRAQAIERIAALQEPGD
ncbi:MAG TPA: TIGR00282 family metallophosphoesterase [bacterium]|nr:TIGR00282 family metallophosphoesterase [bacterium]